MSDRGRVPAGVLWRATLLAAFLVVAVIVTLTVGLPEERQLRGWLDGVGAWGPALFVVLYAVTSLAPVPKAVLSVLGGLLFGVVAGVALVVVGAMLGAVASFAIGRTLGREAVERLTGARVARVDELLTRRGLWSVVAVRLVPFIPFTVVNYAAGLTAVRWRDYLLGTAVGILPGTTAYVTVGAEAYAGWSPALVASLGLLALLSVGGLLVARRSRRSGGGAAVDPPAAERGEQAGRPGDER